MINILFDNVMVPLTFRQNCC